MIADYGDGWVWIPPYFAKALYYDHKPRRLEKRLILVTKNGLYFEALAHIVWSVNREALDAYFENPDIAKDIDIHSTAAIQRWARKRSFTEIYEAQPDDLTMPIGSKLLSVTLLNVAPTEKTKKITEINKKDFSMQLHALIDDVQTIAELETLRKTLRDQLPGQAKEIDLFCNQQKAKIQTRRMT